ncbi:uncharacterized protein LOC131695685 [Topomyia yanbarensis]|uniref:uncharacterized protein LOC131695685 n=1 Tax=Topomyia yanbarensis TaxID=2498891 RepID=UPI00273C08CC|nr:uncharacterized protein LOC131695685 [Topomyia yanbarensis]
MVVNSVPSKPASTPGGPAGTDSIDRQYSFYRPYPFFHTMYNPGYNPYLQYGPQHPPLTGPAAGPPYPVYQAADMSQGYSSKFGPPSGSGYGGGSTGHGSSYGPPGPSSSGGGYEYHPRMPAHTHHPTFHFSSPKSKKGKGAALSALTLLAFLYFLNMLQSCLKEHMDTMNPTVMVMTAGATRRKDVGDVIIQQPEEMVGEYDAANGYDVATDRYRNPYIAGGNRTQAGPNYYGSFDKSHKFQKPEAGGDRFRGSSKDQVIYYDD